MHEHYWGWMIVVYLFLGGLGAGSLALGGAAHLSRRPELRRIARAGALAAPLLVGAGSGLLIFDLGSPLKFWRLFTHVNPVSPMSVGSWLLLGFTAVSSVYAALHLPPEWLVAVARRFRRADAGLLRLAAWNRPASDPAVEPAFPRSPRGVRRLRDGLALAGIFLGVGVGIYTGVLLGAIPARPFWNTPMVAQLFLFSALSTATALLALVTPRVWRDTGDDWSGEHRTLLRADLVFIVLELFLILPFIVHGELSTLSARQALGLILGGPYTKVFWGGVVLAGILLPMALEALELAGALRRLPAGVRRGLDYLVPLLILAGGYLIRWVFVHAGQDSAFV